MAYLVNFYILIIILPLVCGFGLKNVFIKEITSLNNSLFISSACGKDLNEMIRELDASAGTWAWKILDASSKIQSGIAILNEDIGQFDECIQAENKDGAISGKYCLGNINVREPEKEFLHVLKAKHRLMENVKALTGTKISPLATPKITWAGCLPKSCSIEDFTYLYNLIFQHFISNLEVDFTENLCSTKYDNENLTTGAILTMSFFSAFICIMLIETFYDLYCQQVEKEPSQFLIAFSMYTNTHKLFKLSKSGSQLDCLHGLKFFSMVWVVLGHTFSEALQAPLANFLDVLTWSDNLYSMLLVNGTLSVDTFFVVGGCLVAYVYMQAMEKERNLNILVYYLHRIIRLTPPLAALILVIANITPYLGNGPRWLLVQQYQSFCQENWWSTLLYIQNYVSVPKLCGGHCWYLAIDMQLYVLSPFIMYSLRRYTKFSVVGLVAVILASTGVNFAIAWNEKYGALLSNIYIDSTNYQSHFYIKTHARAGSWIMGILVGYLIFELKQTRLRFRLNRALNIFIWIWCLALLLFCIFIGHGFLRTSEYNQWGNSLHIAFVRNLWSLGVSWIMIACSLGYGGGAGYVKNEFEIYPFIIKQWNGDIVMAIMNGWSERQLFRPYWKSSVTARQRPINWFLSLPFYQVFNRFAYSIYLVHFVLIDMWYSSTKTQIHFSNLMMGYYFWGHICFTCIISYFWVLLFESPFIVLEKIVLGSLMNSRRQITAAQT